MRRPFAPRSRSAGKGIAMIIWINGAFGAGKTQTAYELRRRIKHAYVYDPENAGYFIRENVPPAIREGDFQDYPMWRTFNREMLDYIASRFSGVILVPMTVTDRAYWDEMAGALAEKHGVRHFILCARRETLLRRLASRLEGRRSWAAGQIDRCIAAFERDIQGEKLYTDTMSIRETAEQIAALAGVALTEDRRSGPRRVFDRVLTQLRHIR